MSSSSSNEQLVGILVTTLAYMIWGFLPLYWKLIQFVPPGEILAHRIVWSFVFVIGILIFMGKLKQLFIEVKELVYNRKRLIGLSLASLVISLNWVIYIWAVNANHVVEASLGYYINPLVSIILGVLVLKEKLSLWQSISFGLALLGVLNLTINYGSFPWVALSLAISFGIYGLLKKLVKVGPIIGLAIETLLITPFALLFLSYTHVTNGGAFASNTATTLVLLGAGIVTAVPLLLFANGASRIPLSTLGFLQYFAPTIMLLLGVFVYKEPFTDVHLLSFICIWTALTIYTLSKTKWFIYLESKMIPAKKSMQG
jgi:chloramphenicol-sensitive protein RarD